MGRDRSEYEALIDSTHLFDVDREKERTLYRREAIKMTEYLYLYLMEVNSRDYEPYAVEIVDTARRCIRNYDPAEGRFLNYFNASWKKTYGHIVGKSLVEATFGGMRFKDDEVRNYRKYNRLAQSMGMDTGSEEFDQKVADAMGITIEEIHELKVMVESRPVAGGYLSEDGEEFNIIEMVDSGERVDDELLRAEDACELLDTLERTYDRLQERQKPLLAALITAKLSYLTINEERLAAHIKEKSFFDGSTYEETIRSESGIQAKDIAGRFGVSEASISRTWKAFKDKVGKQVDV